MLDVVEARGKACHVRRPVDRLQVTPVAAIHPAASATPSPSFNGSDASAMPEKPGRRDTDGGRSNRDTGTETQTVRDGV